MPVVIVRVMQSLIVRIKQFDKNYNIADHLSHILFCVDKNTNIHMYSMIGKLFFHLIIWKDDDSRWLQTFGEAQFLSDGARNFGSGGIAVEVDLIHAVPIHMGPTQL